MFYDWTNVINDLRAGWFTRIANVVGMVMYHSNQGKMFTQLTPITRFRSVNAYCLELNTYFDLGVWIKRMPNGLPTLTVNYFYYSDLHLRFLHQGECLTKMKRYRYSRLVSFLFDCSYCTVTGILTTTYKGFFTFLYLVFNKLNGLILNRIFRRSKDYRRNTNVF